ncbi:MAG: hypothetical protein IJF24_02050 [Clostridia bacterium]|nr:hypothetical protein [Clostridia bacterium]
MKRILCLCLLLAVLFSAASCEPIGLPRPAPNYSASEDLAQNVEADSIRYYCSPTTKYNVFILERDGKFGVIDGFGKVLVEPTWDCATLTHTAKDESEWGKAEVKVLLSNRTENGYPRMEGMFVEADGTLTEGTSGGWDYGRSLVYWDSNEKTPLLFSSGDGITEFRSTDVKDYRRPFRSSAYFFAAADTREKVVAVQAISDYELVEENGGVHLYVTEEKDGKYALLSLETGKLLTDFVYEDYDRTGEVNDVIAMKKNGSWGYVDSAGREISEFYYLPCYTGENGEDGFYPNCNGYIAVCEGELYGLIEEQEGRVAEASQFADITMPTPHGRYWAKDLTGKWSAHKLG